MAKPLAQHVAVISGGLGDIGRAIALELARRGADIAIGDIRPPGDAATTLGQIAELGVRCRYDRVDVSKLQEDDDDVAKWFGEVERTFGGANLIIPNAAVVTVSPLMKMSRSEWMRELQVNLTGAFHMAQTGAARLLQHQRPGRIVFTGSWAAHAPHPAITAYCVAKAGLRMLCKCMALELAPHGILVNEVAPGYVDAGLSAGVWKANPEARGNAQAPSVSINQLIDAGEVALQVAHLCDPANRHMTGSTLLMDGGLSLVTPAAKR